MTLDVVDGDSNKHGASVIRVFDGLEQLNETAQRVHRRLCHWLCERHVQVHYRLHQVADVVRIQQTLVAKYNTNTLTKSVDWKRRFQSEKNVAWQM